MSPMERAPGLGHVPERLDGLLIQVDHLAMRRAGGRRVSRKSSVPNRLLPLLSAIGVMRERFEVLVEPLAVEGLVCCTPGVRHGNKESRPGGGLMPGRRFRIHTQEVKLAVVRRVLAGEKIRAVAHELRLGNLLYTWLDHYEQGGAEALVPRGRPSKAVAWARRRALTQAPSRQARPTATP